jgi:uncharacterized membrane protein
MTFAENGQRQGYAETLPFKKPRLESIDLLRGIVIVFMALDHTRDYFHNDAFFFSPEDLSKTNVILFFTRWITHFCAPVFVLLAGMSAYLHGARTGKKELAYFLLTRGLWLVFVELFIVSLFRSFNPTYPFFNLQVIWAIGVSMLFLSAMIYLQRYWILAIGILLVAGHNLLDNVHVAGNSGLSFTWSLLHDPRSFQLGNITLRIGYPLLPWIGIMALGYCLGSLYDSGFNGVKRRTLLLVLGIASILLFVCLRIGNFYGDPSPWNGQDSFVFGVLSFMNVTKYPPSLLYCLLLLGPALFFLSVAERPLNRLTRIMIVFGRVPMFFYLAHILLIHMLAVPGVMIQGREWTDMVLNTTVLSAPSLKGYGFDLPVVYAIWVLVLLLLYPLCKKFGVYKRAHQSKKKWLNYL